jgi:hypothetical protein
MRLSTTPPTSYGIASKCEYIQIEIKHPLIPLEISSRINTHLPPGASVIACTEGRLRQVKAFTYKTLRPFSLTLPPDACVIKEGTSLLVADYLEYSDPHTLRIAFRKGRTISPVLLLETYSQDKLRLEEVIKTETRFVEDKPREMYPEVDAQDSASSRDKE